MSASSLWCSSRYFHIGESDCTCFSSSALQALSFDWGWGARNLWWHSTHDNFSSGIVGRSCTSLDLHHWLDNCPDSTYGDGWATDFEPWRHRQLPHRTSRVLSMRVDSLFGIYAKGGEIYWELGWVELGGALVLGSVRHERFVSSQDYETMWMLFCLSCTLIAVWDYRVFDIWILCLDMAFDLEYASCLPCSCIMCDTFVILYHDYVHCAKWVHLNSNHIMLYSYVVMNHQKGGDCEKHSPNVWFWWLMTLLIFFTNKFMMWRIRLS